MAKFYGDVGFGENVETSPGVWEDVITVRKYYGDIIKKQRNLQDETKINSDISLTNTISILTDAYANSHLFAIRFIDWAGALWSVTNVEVQSPRLILRLGDIYNGPKASAPESP